MTHPTPAPTSDSGPAAPVAPDLGHPVRSFSLTLVGVGLLLLALQASGLVLPRVTNPDGSRGTGESTEGQAWAWAVIENEGLLDVRIEEVSWPITGATDTRVEIQPRGVTIPGTLPDSLAAVPFEPVTLDPGERRVVVATGRPTCQGSLHAGTLTVRARTALGVTREVVVRLADLVATVC